MADPQTDATIAKLWPERWAKANAAPRNASKYRQKLRKDYRLYLKLQELRKQDAKCANCRSRIQGGLSAGNRMICGRHSDFYGYVEASSNDLCDLWEHKAAGGAS